MDYGEFGLTKTLDLEWKCTYVGSAENEKLDQVLDSIFVGPVNVGVAKFTLEVKFRFFSIRISENS